MSLQVRVMVASGGAIAFAVILLVASVFYAERESLDAQIDAALRSRADEVAEQLYAGDAASADAVSSVAPPTFGGPGGYAQVITATEVIHLDPNGPFLPVTPRAIAVAAAAAPSLFEEMVVDGVHVRVFTTPIGPGRAIQVARPLDEFDDHLLEIAILLGLFTVIGIGMAAVLGWLVARASLRPMNRLLVAVDGVATSGDLGRRVEVEGGDDVARLAAKFNATFGALDRSVQAQTRLVADASHELRTPVTSIRTNIEVLERRPDLPDAERVPILMDVLTELAALTTLIDDILDTGRDEHGPTRIEEVRVDTLVLDAVARARGSTSSVAFVHEVQQASVRADPIDVGRLIRNLVDNAIKWSPAGGTVLVRVRDGSLDIIDDGPGFAPTDVDRVFDRFYRSPSARATPGSGLGLAIVERIARRYGWVIWAGNAPGHGAHVRITMGPSPNIAQAPSTVGSTLGLPAAQRQGHWPTAQATHDPS